VATLQAEPIAVIEPLETRMQARLEFLKKNRDEYIATAQRQIAALDAAIGEISALLEPASLNGHEDSSVDAT
jgi:hypothetical protein